MPIARNNKYVLENDTGQAEAGERCGRGRRNLDLATIRLFASGYFGG